MSRVMLVALAGAGLVAAESLKGKGEGNCLFNVNLFDGAEK